MGGWLIAALACETVPQEGTLTAAILVGISSPFSRKLHVLSIVFTIKFHSREMCAVLMTVEHLLVHQALQVMLIENDHMVEQAPTDLLAISDGRGQASP
jgi:hypothetical protein